jgi:hypothetical protein
LNPVTNTNPKGAGRNRVGKRFTAQISGLSDEAMAHLECVNKSEYIRELIHTDLANKLSK